MKKLMSAVVISTVAMFSSLANAGELEAADNSIYTNLCMVAATGNRVAMYNAINSSGKSKKYVMTKVQCNSADVIAFVEEHGRNVAAFKRAFDTRGQSVSITDIAMIRKEVGNTK